MLAIVRPRPTLIAIAFEHQFAQLAVESFQDGIEFYLGHVWVSFCFRFMRLRNFSCFVHGSLILRSSFAHASGSVSAHYRGGGASPRRRMAGQQRALRPYGGEAGVLSNCAWLFSS